MKICKILIQDYHQFTDFQLDLTYPEGHEKAGEPLEKVCFIGQHGTGKSTILSLLNEYLGGVLQFKSQKLMVVRLKVAGKFLYSVHINKGVVFLNESIDEEPGWLGELLGEGAMTMAFSNKYEKHAIGFEDDQKLLDDIWFDNNSNNLILYAPAESRKNYIQQLTDGPPLKGHEAEILAGNFPYKVEVSSQKIMDFWILLIYLLAGNEAKFREFRKAPEHTGKSEDYLRELFSRRSPDIIDEIANLWNPLLKKCGLTLDARKMARPSSPKDKLEFIITDLVTGAYFPYNELSVGLRNHLFRIAQVCAWNHGRTIQNGFLLLEEPELGLNPDIVSGVVSLYTSFLNNSQTFMTTCHPMVARQFAPEERMILEFTKPGKVQVRRSTCSPDASLEEILLQDFGSGI